MERIKQFSIILGILLFFLYNLFKLSSTVFAQDVTCPLTSPSEINKQTGPTTITISQAYSSSFSQVKDVRGWAGFSGIVNSGTPLYCTNIKNIGGNSISASCDVSGFGIVNQIRFDVVDQNGSIRCNTQNIPIVNNYPGTECAISISPNPPMGGDPYTVKVTNLPNLADTGVLYIDTTGVGVWVPVVQQLTSGTTYTQEPKSVNTHVYYAVGGTVNGEFYNFNKPICTTDFVVGTTPAPDQGPGPGGTTSLGTTQICNFIPADNPERGLCVSCFAKPGVWTPFGCIETDPQKFVEDVLKIAIGLAGGIAFLMIIYGGFVTMMSSGNPEKLTEGREIITSAIAGLLLIVFSVVILKIIGVDILGIL